MILYDAHQKKLSRGHRSLQELIELRMQMLKAVANAFVAAPAPTTELQKPWGHTALQNSNPRTRPGLLDEYTYYRCPARCDQISQAVLPVPQIQAPSRTIQKLHARLGTSPKGF